METLIPASMVKLIPQQIVGKESQAKFQGPAAYTIPDRGRSLRHVMGRKQGVDRKEPGGLAPCSICGAVIDPTPWQVPVQGESSWFLPVCQEGSTVPFFSCHRRLGGAGGGQQPCWVHCCQIAENSAKKLKYRGRKNLFTARNWSGTSAEIAEK